MDGFEISSAYALGRKAGFEFLRTEHKNAFLQGFMNVLQGKWFGNMTDEEKETIIQKCLIKDMESGSCWQKVQK